MSVAILTIGTHSHAGKTVVVGEGRVWANLHTGLQFFRCEPSIRAHVQAKVMSQVLIRVAKCRTSSNAAMGQIVGPALVQVEGRGIGTNLHACSSEILSVPADRAVCNTITIEMPVQIRARWTTFDTFSREGIDECLVGGKTVHYA